MENSKQLHSDEATRQEEKENNIDYDEPLNVQFSYDFTQSRLYSILFKYKNSDKTGRRGSQDSCGKSCTSSPSEASGSPFSFAESDLSDYIVQKRVDTSNPEIDLVTVLGYLKLLEPDDMAATARKIDVLKQVVNRFHLPYGLKFCILRLDSSRVNDGKFRVQVHKILNAVTDILSSNHNSKIKN